jgi:hypothetical protein
MTKDRLASLLSFGLFVAFGFILLLRATPEGLGLNDDSVAYVSGARGIISGEGYRELWIVSQGPITHFPPGFPFTLALLGFISNIDPLRIVRVLNAFYFGANAALLGLLGWRVTRSYIVSALLSLFFLITPAFLQIHSMAMSEPQYIFLTLLIILIFDLYLERDSKPLLVLAGLLSGYAYLTRYAALALIATLFFALLILHDTWRKRMIDSLVYVVSSALLIIGWSIRNAVAGGSLTNREPGWHPITSENFNLGLREFSLFITPLEQLRQNLFKTPYFYSSILLIVAVLLLAWVLYVGLRRFILLEKAPKPPVIPFLHVLYLFGYFSSLVVTMTYMDPATKFQLRIVAPLYVSMIFIAVIAGYELTLKLPASKWIMSILAVMFISMFAMAQNSAFADLARGGQLYASYRWYDSKLLAEVRSMPEDVAVYTGRPCHLLPGNDEQAQQVREDVKNGKAVILIFYNRELEEEIAQFYNRLGEGLETTREGSAVLYK